MRVGDALIPGSAVRWVAIDGCAGQKEATERPLTADPIARADGDGSLTVHTPPDRHESGAVAFAPLENNMIHDTRFCFWAHIWVRAPDHVAARAWLTACPRLLVPSRRKVSCRCEGFTCQQPTLQVRCTSASYDMWADGWWDVTVSS
jgi:hypothetical protein